MEISKQSKLQSLRDLFKRVHSNEKGGVSLETILIIGAIALPILIFLIMFAWPRVQQYFVNGVEQLETGANTAKDGGASGW